MNVLPLVISFLLIFGIMASQFFHRYSAIAIEKRSIEGYLKAQRLMWNKHQKAAFRKQKGEKGTPVENKGKNENDKKEKKEDINYFRDKRCSHESGKFNLYRLLHDPDSVIAKNLYEPAASLIKHLYQKTSFWREGQDLEYQILDGLIQKKEISFYDAFIEKPELAQVFYKMLKGTNTYEAETSNGIPPFFDFFRDDSSKDKIDFCHAPKALVKVIFEDELWKKIEQAERKENKPLPKKDLYPLLEAFPEKKSQLETLDLFSFGNDRKRGEVDIAIDDATGITIKRW